MAALLLFLFVSSFSYAQAEDVAATLYDLQTNRAKKIFTLSVDLTFEGGHLRSTARYQTPEGELAVEEKGSIRGAKLLEYEIYRKQTNEKGRISIQGETISFEYEKDGVKKVASEKVRGETLSSANFNAYIQENWDSLVAGKELDIRYAVWDRLETVGFSLKKINEMQNEGERWLELRMKPSSFVIAALVDPIHLWYGLGDKKLKLMKGRVPPKILKEGRWRDLDAEVVYENGLKSVSK